MANPDPARSFDLTHPRNSRIPAEVQQFLRENPRFNEIVNNTDAHLAKHFPAYHVRWEVMPEPETPDEPSLYCAVVTPLDFDEAEERLEAFCQHWWYKARAKAGSGIIIGTESE